MSTKKSEQIEIINDLLLSFKNSIDLINEEKEEKVNLGFKDYDETLKSSIHNLKESYLVFSGEYSTGKSTFVNAILGEEILPTASDPCTSIVTEISFCKDISHRFYIHFLDKSTKELYSLAEATKLLDGRSGEVGYFATIHHLEWIYGTGNTENKLVKLLADNNIRIIDTPGFNSPYGFNEGVVTEYLAKAKFCYWLFPVNKFGGTRSKEFLKNIMKNNLIGDFLVPVFTKADLIDDEDRKDEIVDSFTEHYGNIFKNAGSVSFVSPIKLKESRMERENGNIDKSRELEQKSGIESFVNTMLRNNVNAKIDEREWNKFIQELEIVYKNISVELEKYSKKYDDKLKSIGWDINSNENQKLLKLRKSLQNQAKSVSKDINDNFINEVESKISLQLSTSSNLNASQQAKVIEKLFEDILNKYIEQDIENFINKLAKEFHLEYHDVTLEKLETISLDLTGTVKDNMKKIFSSTNEVVHNAGFETVLKGIVSGGLYSSAQYFSGIALIGGTLASLATAGAAGLAIVTISGLVKSYIDVQRRNKEKDDNDMKRLINQQLKQLKLDKILLQEFTVAIDAFFKETSSDELENINELKNKYSKLEQAKENIKETYKDLKEIGK